MSKISMYMLTSEYMHMLDVHSDPEIDEPTVRDTIEASGLDEAIEEKAENYAKVMQELEGQVTILKAEEQRLSSKRKACEASIDRLKKTLEGAMIATGKTKFKTTLFSFNIQKNAPSVVFDVELDKVPKKWFIKQDPKLDKEGIKKALAEGSKLKFAHLEQTESLRIR